jgi:hypothetical protein
MEFSFAAPVDKSVDGRESAGPPRYLAAGKIWGSAMAAKQSSGFEGTLDKYFGLRKNGTTVRTEFIAGLTTFLTMVYIVFVNPAILSKTGMDAGAVFVATCIAAAVSTLVMALYANYPIALAPGMGINAFFAFTVVLTYKYTWQFEARGIGRRRLVPRHHRAGGSQSSGRPSGHARHAR